MIYRQSFEVFILPVKSAFRGLFDKKWNLCKAPDYLSLRGFLSLWSKNVFPAGLREPFAMACEGVFGATDADGLQGR